MPPDPRIFQDAEHLRYLAIGHYVLGSLTALFACFPLMHVVIGVMMVSGKFPGGPGGMPPEAASMGWLFIGMGALFIVGGWGLAVVMLLCGRWLSARRNHAFCFVVSCIECAFMPLGTILGVFSLVVLQRPSVKSLFETGTGIGAWSRA